MSLIPERGIQKRRVSNSWLWAAYRPLGTTWKPYYLLAVCREFIAPAQRLRSSLLFIILYGVAKLSIVNTSRNVLISREIFKNGAFANSWLWRA